MLPSWNPTSWNCIWSVYSALLTLTRLFLLILGWRMINHRRSPSPRIGILLWFPFIFALHNSLAIILSLSFPPPVFFCLSFSFSSPVIFSNESFCLQAQGPKCNITIFWSVPVERRWSKLMFCDGQSFIGKYCGSKTCFILKNMQNGYLEMVQ